MFTRIVYVYMSSILIKTLLFFSQIYHTSYKFQSFLTVKSTSRDRLIFTIFGLLQNYMGLDKFKIASYNNNIT